MTNRSCTLLLRGFTGWRHSLFLAAMGMSTIALLPLIPDKLSRAQVPEVPMRSVSDPGMITTRQVVTPAGVPAIVNGRVLGVAFGANSDELLLSTTEVFYELNWRTNKLLFQNKWSGVPGTQSLQYDSRTDRALSVVAIAGQRDQPPRLELFSMRNNFSIPIVSNLGSYTSGAFTVAAQTHVTAIPLTYDNELALVDLDHGHEIRKAPTGVAPFAAAINRNGTVVYVSNWGGRVAKPGDRTATSGEQGTRQPNEPKHPPDPVVIDTRGIVATGTVTRIDVASGKNTNEIPVGLHPTAMVWDEARDRLYVANSNDDSVSIIDTASDRVLRTLPIQPFSQHINGVAPTALAITSDGKTMFVACGGINAVAQVNVAKATIEGLIPTAWYPASLALSPDGRYLAIGTLFGVGSGAYTDREKRSVHAERGSVHVVELPEPAQLANDTTVVAEDNHLLLPGAVAPTGRRGTTPLPVPLRSGDPSLIEHVVLVVKENRTYDQVLGDMKKGNSDPALVMFGKDITPNTHRLADEFVLLDNFYATGGISADGHQWLTQANETEYAMWPGYQGRSYPFDGTDPIAYSRAGFLWDLALAHKKTVRVYGEFTPLMTLPLELRRQYLQRVKQGEDFTREFAQHSPIPPLDRIMAHNYPGYSNAIPDQVRAQIFLSDLQEWARQGSMPNLTLIQLNCDHTVGTTPGVSTPNAMVADNDLALGRIVEAISRSRFWPRTAVFVVEDDGQNGVDHVDGHRTVSLVISPYSHRGTIDSTFYSHQSILKTIELMLGLPTLSLFDLIADDMRNSFLSRPDSSPYTAFEPKQSLFELNPLATSLHGAGREGALASSRMNFDVPDAAPSARLNQILWHSVRGWDVPYPARKSAVFAPLILDGETDNDDEPEREPK